VIDTEPKLRLKNNKPDLNLSLSMQMKHRKTSESDSTAAESAKCVDAAELTSSVVVDVDDELTTLVPCKMPSKTVRK